MTTKADFMKAKLEAEKVLEENFIESPPIDVVEITKNYGYNISEVELSPEVAGLVDESKKIIYVSSQDSSQRKAFTIAHELGHIKLHKAELTKDPNIGILYRIPLGHRNGDTKEQEANYFAANLLVPEKQLKQIQNKYGNLVTKESLAKLFGVSVDVIGYRLKDIAIQNGSQV